MIMIMLHNMSVERTSCEIKIRLVGQDSIVDIVICYRLCSLGIELWWGQDFGTCSDWSWGPSSPL